MSALNNEMIQSIVYNWAKVYKSQNYLRQLSSWKSLTNVIKSSVTQNPRNRYLNLFKSTLFLWLWRQSAGDRVLSVKPELGHLGRWQTVQTQIRRHKMHLIRVYMVCLNYRKLRIKRNSLKSKFKAISKPTLRQSTHQCCQCFDLQRRGVTVLL